MLITVIALAVGGFFVYQIVTVNADDEENPAMSQVSAPNDPKTDDTGESVDDIDFEVSDESKNGLPSEKDFSDDLHHMTHSFVSAHEKWGAVEVTDERIEEMLEIAEPSDYEYRDFYIESLEAWQVGDFSNADNVHNLIWNAHHGTIGRAFGLMDSEEQREFYEENFDKDFEKADYFEYVK